MKITDVSHFIIHTGWRKNWIFVRIQTDEGIVGWGESYSQYDRDRAVASHIGEMARYLAGWDPFQVKYFTTMFYDDFAARRGSLEFYSALSGIEMAMWDIVGKAVNQPAYNLLGGKCRERVRVYANGWSYKMADPDDYVRAAVRVVEQGFTALKLDPLPRPWRTYIPAEHERHAVKVVAALRNELGTGVDLLLDLHRRLSSSHAIRLARRLEEFEPYWIEEPCQAENLGAIAEVRAQTEIPVVTGENVFAKAGFRNVFEQNAVDIINPDVANCGGMLELKEIAAMAEPYFVAVSPHNYNSTTLALSATAHVSAVMPNFIITEYFLPFVELGNQICSNQLRPVNGYITLPDAPGLGLDINEKAVRGFPSNGFPARVLATTADER